MRTFALFGQFGGTANISDGRHVYMRAPTTPDNGPLYQYTLIPCHIRERFSLEELRQADWSPLSFTKGCGVMRVPQHAPPPLDVPIAAMKAVAERLDELGICPRMPPTKAAWLACGAS